LRVNRTRKLFAHHQVHAHVNVMHFY
jgi:hypothetical protein